MIKGVLALLPIVHNLNSQVIAQRLARRLAQSRTSRCLRESDEQQHIQNQINSNEQPNKHHEMIEHDFRKFLKKISI